MILIPVNIRIVYFLIDSGKGIDYDWDGLKRVYEDIEAKDLENSEELLAGVRT